jgi:hypothetical protein
MSSAMGDRFVSHRLGTFDDVTGERPDCEVSSAPVDARIGSHVLDSEFARTCDLYIEDPCIPAYITRRTGVHGAHRSRVGSIASGSDQLNTCCRGHLGGLEILLAFANEVGGIGTASGHGDGCESHHQCDEA